MVRLFGQAEQRRHELLSAYVDGEVTAEEAREVEDLLASSEDARRELAELRATVDLVRGLPELEPPRSFALDAAPEKRWTLWWPSVRTTGLATSVAAMLLVGLVAGDMLDVLEQARFGADEEAIQDSAFDDSAFAAAAPAQEAMAGVAMDVPASPEPEVALMKSVASEDETAQIAAAPAAAAPRMAKVESSEEPVAAMQQASTEEAAQADQAESDEEPEVAMQSVMSADEPQANEAESSEEPVAAMQQASMEEAAQADQAESAEEPQVAMQSVMSADEPQANEAESSEEPVAAMQQASTEGGHPIEGYDPGDEFYGIDESDPDGITLPLVELQIATAIVVAVLVGATLVAVRRRRRSLFQREE